MDYAAIVVLEILYMIAFLALISAGLAIVFGMMRVINLAHGEFVMLGGYATIAAAKAGINVYFAMLVIAPIVVGIIGLVTLIFGNTPVSVPTPIPGYRIGHYQMGGYNLFVIAVAVVLMCAMWFALRYTRVGLIARGTMQGRDVVASLGYNPSTIFMLTFTVGAALSGLAGGVMAPLTGLLPSIGGAYIAKAFITVITGGAAVIAGTLSTAGLFGTVDQLVSFASTPVLGEIAMLALALVLLRLMPQGVTGQFFRNST